MNALTDFYLLRSREFGPNPTDYEKGVLAGLEAAIALHWPDHLMCRLRLPVSIREIAMVCRALGNIAQKQGKDACMKQVGQTLEIFTVEKGQP
jgi:hypothetical protein